MMPQSSIRKASIINVITRYSSIFIQILYNAVLARILTPKDFGIVAILTIFSSFFSLLANMGIGTAIIQNKELSESDTDSLFSLTVYLGLLSMIFFVGLSFPISTFFDNVAYRSLGVVLSISLCFNIWNTVPNAMLFKQKRFLAVGLRSIVVTLLSSSITIIMAIAGLRYYSIVFYSVISSILLFIWNMINVKLKMSLKIEWSSINKILSYASFQFLFNITNYFSRNLDSLLIGKYLGDISLGFYNKSYTLMLYPIQNLTHVITPVLHPILSDYQKDKKLIFSQYMKVVKVLSLIGVIVTPFSYYAADELILLIFGTQWSQAIPTFRILSLSLYVQMVSSSAGTVYQSTNNTRLMFASCICFTSVIIVCVLFGLYLGTIESIACLIVIGYHIKFFIDYYFLVKKGLKYHLLDFYKFLWKDFLIMLCIFLSLGFFCSYHRVYSLVNLLLKLFITLGVFFLGIMLSKQNDVIKKIFGRG